MKNLKKFIQKILLENYLQLESMQNAKIANMTEENRTIAENWAEKMNNEGGNSRITIDIGDTKFKLLTLCFEYLAYAFKEGEGATFTFPITGRVITVNKRNIIEAMQTAIDPSNKRFISYISSKDTGGTSKGLGVDAEMAKNLNFINIARSQIVGKLSHQKTIDKFHQTSGIAPENAETPSIIEDSIYQYISKYISEDRATLFMYITNNLRNRIRGKIKTKDFQSGIESKSSIDSEFGTRHTNIQSMQDYEHEVPSDVDIAKFNQEIEFLIPSIVKAVESLGLQRKYYQVLKVFSEFATETVLKTVKGQQVPSRMTTQDKPKAIQPFYEQGLIPEELTNAVNAMMTVQNKSFSYCLKEIKKEAIRAATKKGLTIKIANSLLEKRSLPEDFWDINAKNDVGEAFITFLFKATTPKVDAWLGKFTGQAEPTPEKEDDFEPELSDAEIERRIQNGLMEEGDTLESSKFTVIDLEKTLNRHNFSLISEPSELNEVRKKIKSILIKKLIS